MAHERHALFEETISSTAAVRLSGLSFQLHFRQQHPRQRPWAYHLCHRSGSSLVCAATPQRGAGHRGAGGREHGRSVACETEARRRTRNAHIRYHSRRAVQQQPVRNRSNSRETWSATIRDTRAGEHILRSRQACAVYNNEAHSLELMVPASALCILNLCLLSLIRIARLWEPAIESTFEAKFC
jgi:hypothetical protein